MRTNILPFTVISILAIEISQAFVIGRGRLVSRQTPDDGDLQYSVPAACDNTCKTFVDVFAAEPVSTDCTKSIDDSLTACYTCAVALSNSTEVATYNEIMDDYYAYCTKVGSPVPTQTGGAGASATGATNTGASGATFSNSIIGATFSSAHGSTPTSPASADNNGSSGGDSGNGIKGLGGAGSMRGSLGSSAVMSLVVIAGLLAL